MRFFRRSPHPQVGGPTFDPAETAWLRAKRRPFETFSVGSLVPVAFDRYVRVLHPASSYGNLPVRWTQVAAWSGRTAHGLAQWDLLSRPVTGLELGQRPFILPPRAGGLPSDQLRALCEVLAGATTEPEHCFSASWDGYGDPAMLWADGTSKAGGPPTVPVAAPQSDARELRFDYRAFLVVEGSIATVAATSGRGLSYQLPPTLFWPRDRAWFVATDPDLDSTYVGGSAELIATILATPLFEAWPAGPDDDITIGADEINLDREEVVPAGQLSWFDPPEPRP